MVATGNGRTKRKNVSIEVKTEPEKKYLKRNDILLEYQALKKKFNVLEEKHTILIEENATHMDAIEMLEETVKLLELKISNVENKSASVQTDISRCEQPSVESCETQTEDEVATICDKCDYPTNDICNVEAHSEEFHSLESDYEIITCHYCKAKLKTKEDLMIHRKKVHREKVSICRHFIEGNCYFEIDECWFIHDTPVAMLMCTFCDKEFHIKTDLMNHRKYEHEEKMKSCKKASRGECPYNTNCWYKHKEVEIVNQNQNQEMFDKLFEIMEKFTHRIVNIENNL